MKFILFVLLLSCSMAFGQDTQHLIIKHISEADVQKLKIASDRIAAIDAALEQARGDYEHLKDQLIEQYRGDDVGPKPEFVTPVWEKIDGSDCMTQTSPSNSYFGSIEDQDESGFGTITYTLASDSCMMHIVLGYQ